MPNFMTKRWHGYHMILAMCFNLILIAVLATFNWQYALMGLTFFLAVGWVLYESERAFRKDFINYVQTLSQRIKGANQLAVDQMPFGILLYDRQNRIEWHNSFVKKMVGVETLVGSPLYETLHQLKRRKSPPDRMMVEDRVYEVIHHEEERLYFFRDITRLDQLQKRHQQEQMVIGFLHMDNYDEAGSGMDDQERTLLLTNVTAAITRWAQQHDISLRSFDSDKFFMVLNQKTLEQLTDNRFEILDVVRDLTRHNKIPITLSIGLASAGATILEQTHSAQAALDIALARGGDQAAVQQGERTIFFGGKSNAVEKRTRVRARVISYALSNLIKDSSRVLVMGHDQPDMDALGAAIGVLLAVRANGKEGHIVLGDSNPSIEGLMDAIAEHDLQNDLVSPERSLQLIDKNSLLILVDTHKPSMTIEPRLVEKAERVVVIDHHRRGEEFVRDPVLVYLEPYASSTCELVTELLQYQDERLSMDTLETTALLAGIVVDTKSFAFRSGSRTFEAASFLRRYGADPGLVQSLLKEDLNRFVKRAEIVKNTKVLYDKIAIAVGDEKVTYDQLVIAQAADTLLNMKGIRASFAIGLRNDGKVAISARSQGDVNVQVIMEELGGGGHLTHAAVQLEGMTTNEVRERLMHVLEQLDVQGGDTV